jgi:demethoxyubiquinone hydroxylase (CLK1/Coq7/Cat5 family)
MKQEARKNLIRILQNAHAGELAAAYAYRGHWNSLKESAEKKQIEKIENEEWVHRKNVYKWLTELGAQPRKLREAIFWTIGRILGVLCFVSGWFFPMYFAGRLESQNILEYEEAAEYAKELGMKDCENEMMEMSRIEAEHEEFFSNAVAGHRFLPISRRIFGWS